jgi:hypothetical protein
MHLYGFRATNRVRLRLRRDVGAVGPCDDGGDESEKTAHRSPRSDKGFEATHGDGTNP